jgi:hypothetical protein
MASSVTTTFLLFSYLRNMFKEPSNKATTKHEGLAPSNVPRKLTARDMALGIGRKATEEELDEYLSRPSGKSTSLKKGIAQIKAKLQQKQWRKNGNRNKSKGA